VNGRYINILARDSGVLGGRQSPCCSIDRDARPWGVRARLVGINSGHWRGRRPPSSTKEERWGGAEGGSRRAGADHDLEHHPAVVVLAAGEELERAGGVLEREAVGDELVDVGERAGREERERARVRVRVAERALDVDLARGGGGDRERDGARAHADEHDLAAGRGSVDGHLDARLGAGALEDDVEAVGRLEVREGGVGVRARARERLVGALGALAGGEAEGGGREALGAGEGEPRGVDVDGGDARRAERGGDGAGEEADGADAEDEDGLAFLERRAGGRVQEDGERLGERGLVERALVGQPAGRGVRRCRLKSADEVTYGCRTCAGWFMRFWRVPSRCGKVFALLQKRRALQRLYRPLPQ
jgi:hypothetical protein